MIPMIDLSLSLDEVNKVLVALQTQSTDSMLLAQKIKQQGDSQTHDETPQPITQQGESGTRSVNDGNGSVPE